MEQHHFDIILEQLIMIEQNTRKRVAPTSNFEQLQRNFFDDLNAKTGWGRNEIKEIFIENIEKVRAPIIKGDLPWEL